MVVITSKHWRIFKPSSHVNMRRAPLLMFDSVKPVCYFPQGSSIAY